MSIFEEENRPPEITTTAEDQICLSQQWIEEAHKINDFQALQSIHNSLLALNFPESFWQSCSHLLLTSSSTTTGSLLWRNWYSHWIRWECQSTYREAVLSALFFPYRYFLCDVKDYGRWEGNHTVNYSLALSAAYGNPQAQLYHLRTFSYWYRDDIEKQYEDEEEEEEEVDWFQRETLEKKLTKLFQEKICTSQTQIAEEMIAVYRGEYGCQSNHSQAKETLQRLSIDSPTAFSKSISFATSKEERKILREQSGDRGVLSDYLTAAAFTREEDQVEILRLCDKAGDLGVISRWAFTKEREDYEKALDYYLRLGKRGDKEAYYDAAMMLQELSHRFELTEREKDLLIDSSVKACEAGMSGSDLALRSLLPPDSVYGKLLSDSQKEALQEKMPVLMQSLNERRAAKKKEIKDLNILSKI